MASWAVCLHGWLLLVRESHMVYNVLLYLINSKLEQMAYSVEKIFPTLMLARQ